ncbi:MAG: presqualene diphosphate synthase HpnD [Nocardioidaceae bacterium]
MTTAQTTVREAYSVCAQITRAQARNFHYGIALLPSDRRRALCAIYALARRIDDIGDGDLPTSTKAGALESLRAALSEVDASSDPVLVAVADAARRFPIPMPAFGELIDGVAMDVNGVSYASFDNLVDYCRCVAGSIGRLCLAVFGHADEPRAATYADQLGIALQQTNIIRDVREDLLAGRVYLPQEDLDRFGVKLRLDEHGALDDPDARLAELLRHSCRRARDWYSLGSRLLPLLDGRSRACCLAMSGIYASLLNRIEADPPLVYEHRLSVSPWSKAAVAAAALAGRSR